MIEKHLYWLLVTIRTNSPSPPQAGGTAEWVTLADLTSGSFKETESLDFNLNIEKYYEQSTSEFTSPGEDLPEGCFEVLPHRGVDDEVGGGVQDEEGVVEAGQAEDPVVWCEQFGTAEDPVKWNIFIKMKYFQWMVGNEIRIGGKCKSIRILEGILSQF